MDWELDFIKFIAENCRNMWADIIMGTVTTLGNYGGVWIVMCIVLAVFKRTRKMGLCVALSLVIVLVSVNAVLKPCVDRQRPFEIESELAESIDIALPDDGSFPSGHTAAAFAAAAAVLRYNRKWGVAVSVCAVVMGMSRLYFAVHFPSDVAAGAVVGICAGVVGGWITDRIWGRGE